MKHRLLSQLIIIPMLLLFIMSGVLSSLVPLLKMPQASAAVVNTMADYAFDTPADAAFLGNLKKDIAAGDSSGSSLSQTRVWVRNQVFGSKAFPLDYDQSRTDCSHADVSSLGGCSGLATGDHFGGGGGSNDVWVYTGTYTCLPNKPIGERFVAGGGGSNTDENYVVNYSVSLKMGSGGQYALFDSANNIKQYAWLHWMGFGDEHNPAIQYTPAAPGSGTAQTPTQSIPIKKLPAICHPPDVPDSVLSSSSDNTEGSDAGITNKQIPILSSKATPQNIKDQWKAAGVTAGTGASGLQADSAPTLGCDLGFSGDGIVNKVINFVNPLNWLFCGLIKGMVGIIGVLDNAINSQLSVGSTGNSSNPNQIFCDQKICNAYHEAWSSFRNIALGLLVIFGLVMVISQALGGELLDAYTIRKLLPRVLIAALGITLSWQIMQLLVTLSNDLGYGVRQLIYFPFTHAGLKANISGLGGGTGVATGLVAGVGLAFFDWFGVLAFAGTAALAVGVAFMFLILRQIVIILLLLLAPIGIIAYVLPNTQRAYKLWWESFSKALLMFPIIAGMIAAGRVFSIVALNQGGGGPDFLHKGVAFIAYFAPYFMIPATFRLSGGALSAIGGGLSKASQGGFGALKQFRSGRVKKNTHDLVEGKRLKGTKYEAPGMRQYSKLARAFNRGTHNVANFRNAGYNPSKFGERMASAASTTTTQEALEALEKNPTVVALKSDDDIVEAGLMFDTDTERHAEMRRRGMTKERADMGVAALHHMQNSMTEEGFNKALLIASMGTSSGWTPRYEKDANGNDLWYDSSGAQVAEGTTGAARKLRPGSDQGAAMFREMINKKLGNDRQGAIAVLGAGRQQAEAKGRFDLVGGSFTEDAIMLEQANPLQEGGRKLGTAEWQHQILSNALEGQSRAKIANGHNRSMEALAPVMAEKIREAAVLPGSSGEDAVSQYAFIASSHDYASNSAPEMARHIKQKVLDQKVNVHDIAANNPELNDILISSGFNTGAIRARILAGDPYVTNGEIMEHLRATNEDFGRYRREYSGAASAAGAAAARGPTGP